MMKKRRKVERILEPDFGCEGQPDGCIPTDEVVLRDEKGNGKTISVPDEVLIGENINEGTLLDDMTIRRLSLSGCLNDRAADIHSLPDRGSEGNSLTGYQDTRLQK